MCRPKHVHPVFFPVQSTHALVILYSNITQRNDVVHQEGMFSSNQSFSLFFFYKIWSFWTDPEGCDLPWTLFYSASLLAFFFFYGCLPFVSLWFWHLLVEWVIRPSEASEGHDTGLNRKPTWALQSHLYRPPPPPSQGDNSLRGAALTAPAVIPSLWLRVSTSAAPSDLSWADGGDKAVARSRFERPTQMVYLCSAVPPHCCA